MLGAKTDALIPSKESNTKNLYISKSPFSLFISVIEMPSALKNCLQKGIFKISVQQCNIPSRKLNSNFLNCEHPTVLVIKE